jgi:hypothetical protein
MPARGHMFAYRALGYRRMIYTNTACVFGQVHWVATDDRPAAGIAAEVISLAGWIAS